MVYKINKNYSIYCGLFELKFFDKINTWEKRNHNLHFHYEKGQFKTGTCFSTIMVMVI